MSEAAFYLEEIGERVRRGREIVARQEQIVALLKGYGQDSQSDEKLLIAFRASLQLFEDHLEWCSNPIPLRARPFRALVAVSV